jgi:MFS family permease
MDRKEILYIVLAIFLMTVVFGINDPSENFYLARWFNHLFKVFIFSAIIILVHIMGHKFVANIFKVEARYTLWYFRYLAFTPGMLFTKEENQEYRGRFFIGPVITFIIALLSIGRLPILLFDSLEVKIKKNLRIKKLKFFRQAKKYTQLRDIDEAVVKIAGPLANTLFIFLVSIFIFNYEFYLMSLLFVFFAMIPFPGFDGGAIFEAKYVYLTTLIFIAISFFLIYIFQAYILWLLLFTIIASAIIGVAMYYLIDVK